MKNISFFLNRFPVTSETFVINQITGLIDLGYNVTIVAINKGDLNNIHQAVTDYDLISKTTYLTDESPEDTKLSVRLKRIFSVLKPTNTVKKMRALNVKKFGIHSKSLLLPSIVSRVNSPFYADIFVAHFGTSGVVANKMRELGLLHGKLVTIFHGADISVHSILATFKSDYQNLFETGDAMLPISELWKNRLIEMGCSPNKIFVNRMGINSDLFKCRAFDTALSPKLKVITVARFTEKKGLRDALSAMHILQKQGIEFEYNIVGDGELRGDIEKQINTLNIKNVNLLGYQSQKTISKLLKQSDIFLLPSVTSSNGDMEGIPVSLMEAMAMGLITISTYHSGIPELITNLESGLLVQEHSPEDLAKALISVSNQNVDIENIRKNAMQTVDTYFNQEKLYKEFVGILEKINEQ